MLLDLPELLSCNLTCLLGTQFVRIMFSCLDIRSNSMFPTLPYQFQRHVLQWKYPIILSIEQKVFTLMHSIVIDHSGLAETKSHQILSTKPSPRIGVCKYLSSLIVTIELYQSFTIFLHSALTL
ncbi:unnamed protein product [Umbelopsis ramanniana]